jgi:hypothetical protein
VKVDVGKFLPQKTRYFESYRYYLLAVMDSEYLKKHVGEALAIGLTEVVQKRPVDPIEYLAFWLRKFVENRDFDLKVSTKISVQTSPVI